MQEIKVVLSCEHAVDIIPEAYQSLFASHSNLLATHRGIDFGACSITDYLAKNIKCDVIKATTSRLLIDCNRSLNKKGCFSEITDSLSDFQKEEIINTYYLPFRKSVETCIKRHLAAGHVVWHFSIHSFTPIMNGEVRNADIGLLYDPRRKSERALAQCIKSNIQQQYPAYKLRLNYPYRGISDGFTSYLRKQYSENQYVGIEIESNQKIVEQEKSFMSLKNTLAQALVNISR